MQAADKEDYEESQQDAEGVELFTCPYPDCGRVFKYKKGCVAHQRTKHGGVDEGILQAVEDSEESQTDDEEKEEFFVCPYPNCGRTFKYKKGCIAHQRTKHGGVHGGDKAAVFCCHINNCGRAFYTNASLTQHQKRPHGPVSMSDANFA